MQSEDEDLKKMRPKMVQRLEASAPNDPPGALFGAALRHCWGLLGLLGLLLRISWSRWGASWAHLGNTIDIRWLLNAAWKRLGGDLGPSWGHLAAVLGRLEGLLEPRWRRLGLSWGLFVRLGRAYSKTSWGTELIFFFMRSSLQEVGLS